MLFAFTFRYSSVKFMNLEAEADWLPRLWASLGGARCAFIDVTDLTENVLDEVRMAYGRLGPARIFFIGDQSLSAAGWRDLVGRRLGIASAESERLVVETWDRRRGWDPSRFIANVKRFADALPREVIDEIPEDRNSTARPPAYQPESMASTLAKYCQAVAGFLFIPLLFAFFFSVALYDYASIVLSMIGASGRIPDYPAPARWLAKNSGLALPWVALLVFVYLTVSVGRYVADCGSTANRVKGLAIYSYYCLIVFLLYYSLGSPFAWAALM
jgi:hypothetical protein